MNFKHLTLGLVLLLAGQGFAPVKAWDGLTPQGPIEKLLCVLLVAPFIAGGCYYGYKSLVEMPQVLTELTSTKNGKIALAAVLVFGTAVEMYKDIRHQEWSYQENKKDVLSVPAQCLQSMKSGFNWAKNKILCKK